MVKPQEFKLVFSLWSFSLKPNLDQMCASLLDVVSLLRRGRRDEGVEG